jgi:chromosome partitioning protein
MTIFSLYNIKGGVGKTAAAVNLSYLSAQEDKRVLLCDLDPQGSASYYFRIKPEIKSGLKPLLKGKKKADKNIKATDYTNLDLLPSDFSFRMMDIFLDNLKKSKSRLKDILKTFKNDYDYIFIDCPPNITLVSENIFHASDILLIPVIPTTLSARTFEKLLSFLEQEKLKKLKVVSFFSMVEKRKNLHRESMDLLIKNYPHFLKTIIPYSAAVEKMGVYRAPLGCFNQKSVPAQQYLALWNELKQMI